MLFRSGQERSPAPVIAAEVNQWPAQPSLSCRVNVAKNHISNRGSRRIWDARYAPSWLRLCRVREVPDNNLVFLPPSWSFVIRRRLARLRLDQDFYLGRIGSRWSRLSTAWKAALAMRT